MANLQGYDSAILALLVLLGLAVLTFETCRRYGVNPKENIPHFLFRGTTPLHSMASNAGSSFSVTYLFGGLMLATLYLGRSVLLPLALGIFASWLFLRSWLRKLDPTISQRSFVEQTDNILMIYIDARLRDPAQTKHLSWMYTLNYIMLLAIELAIGRILLATLFPERQLIGNALMAVLCLVVATYLYAGGFRAVLVSDLVQGLVIVAFIAVLVYLGIAQEPGLGSLRPVSFTLKIFGGIGLGLIALAWTVAGLDFSSRLNFEGPRMIRADQKHQFIKDSHILTGAVLLISAWAGSQSSYIPLKTMEPFEFFRQVNASFLAGPPAWVGMIYLAGIFCMLFTTVDTHLLSTLQASHYRKTSREPRIEILRNLLIATIIAVAIPVKWLSVMSIMAASMIVVPFFVLLGQIFPSSFLGNLLPTQGLRVMLGSWIVVPPIYIIADPPEVAQFTIPSLIAAVAVVASALTKSKQPEGSDAWKD